MTTTATPRQPALVCCAAALGLVVTGLLAVCVPPPPPVPAPPTPVGVAGPAAADDPARVPSGPARTGVRQVLDTAVDVNGGLR